MGLDTVEIVISFEEAFGVLVPGEIAETWGTPRDVIEWVYAQQSEGASIACLRMRSFHRLRQGLEEGGWIGHRQLKLDTDLKLALQEKDLRELWKYLGSKHGLYLPSLTRPTWLNWTLYIGIVMGSAWMANRYADGTISKVLLVIVLCLILGSLAYRITEPLAKNWPNHARTPRQLVEYLTMNHPNDMVGTGERLSREQIAETVRKITCEYCNPKDYHEDARFVQDLGLD